ncbi:MAG: four helix bundle protein [Terriglobales bacterium]
MSCKYKDLIVWQKARALAIDVYRVTEKFPKAEVYGLTSQLRRAAVSIPSNIAEGQGRLTKGEFRNFLGQARGSLLELETQLTIAFDLHFLDPEDIASLERSCSEIGKLLNGLIESVTIR